MKSSKFNLLWVDLGQGWNFGLLVKLHLSSVVPFELESDFWEQDQPHSILETRDIEDGCASPPDVRQMWEATRLM
ncbi:hypothetical protein B0H10DRAFT_2193888, partial [Mycena sp. CBHHK59/15]